MTYRSLGLGHWALGLLTTIVLLSGCPFEFGDPDSSSNSCTAESDCPNFHTCSKLYKSCVLTSPAAVADRIVGPFQCPVNGFRLAGMNFAANWSQFNLQYMEGEEERTVTIPSTTTSLDHTCILTRVSDDRFELWAQSGRRFDPAFNQVVFWRAKLVIPGDTKSGISDFVPQDSYIYWCPGLPSEKAWDSSEFTENCEPIRTISAGQILLDFSRLRDFNELAGFLDLGLSQSVSP